MSSADCRPPTPTEVIGIAEAHHQQMAGDHPMLDHSLEEYKNFESEVLGASIAVFDDYITGGPGFHGQVAVVVWDGSPSYATTFTRAMREGDSVNYTWKYCADTQRGDG
jgi:hypothetical protein